MVSEVEGTLRAMMVLQLRHGGGVGANLEELRLWGLEPAQWRSIARAAAREIGRPVQTIEHAVGVWAQLRDWPANELESEIHQRSMRRLIEDVDFWEDPDDPGGDVIAFPSR